MGYFSKLSAGTVGQPIPPAQEAAAPSAVQCSAPAAVLAVQELQAEAVAVPAPEPETEAPSKPEKHHAAQKGTQGDEAAAVPISLDVPADDTAARQAHEAAEAKRKAEWDAQQAGKKAVEQAALDKLAAMSDAEVIQASTKRVGDDMERLTRRSMKEQVAEHIQALCQKDATFARRTMLPGKSMVHCFWYINRKAKEFIEQEIKDAGPNPASGVYGGDVPDDLVFQWAVDYFDDDDAPEDRKNEEKFTPKPYMPKSGAKPGKKAKVKKEPKPKPAPKPKESSGVDGQISLLGAAV